MVSPDSDSRLLAGQADPACEVAQRVAIELDDG
jgi:hypothetical protein